MFQQTFKYYLVEHLKVFCKFKCLANYPGMFKNTFKDLAHLKFVSNVWQLISECLKTILNIWLNI